MRQITKTTLMSDDLNKFVRRNDAQIIEADVLYVLKVNYKAGNWELFVSSLSHKAVFVSALLLCVSNKHINFPYNFNTLSSRQVMRIKKIIY